MTIKFVPSFKTLLSPFFLFLPLFIQAQTIFNGQVRDAYTQAALAGARVRLEDLANASRETLTDSLGRFRFEGVIAGRHQILVSLEGYQEIRISDFLVGRTNIPLIIDLETRISDLPEVTITGRSTGAFLHPLSNKLVVSREQTERLSAGFFDPARLFTNQAGVSPLNDAANHLVIRGNNPAFVKWMIHGTEIINPNHLSNAGTFSDHSSASGGGVNMISASVLNNTYLNKAPSPAGLGNALAGIVDVNLRPGRTDRLTTEAQISLLGMEAGLEGPISAARGSSFLFRYRYSTVGLLSELGAKFGEEDINYQDLMGHLSFPSKNTDWNIFFITGDHQNKYAGLEDSTERTIDKESQDIVYDGGQAIAGISNEWRLGTTNRWVNDLVWSQARSIREFGPAGSKTLGNVNRLRQEKWSLHSRLVSAFKNNAVLTAGFQAQSNLDRAHYQDVVPRTNFDCCPDPYYSIQPYAHYSVRLQNWTVGAGLHSMIMNAISIEPRFQFQYQLSASQSLQLNAGKHSQVPSPISYYPKELRDPMASYQAQAGYRKTNARSGWGLALYYQYHLDVPNSGEYYSLINDNPYDNSFIAQAESKGRIYGMETDFQTMLGKWSWTGNLSLFRSQLIAPSGEVYSSRFDQKYILHSGIGREWEKNKAEAKRIIGIHTQISYAGALRDTPLDEALSLSSGYPVYQFDKFNTIRRPDLYRLDFRIYRRKFYKQINTMLALDIQNLTNKQNFSFSYFDYVRGNTAVNYQLGILPNISFTIEY